MAIAAGAAAEAGVMLVCGLGVGGRGGIASSRCGVDDVRFVSDSRLALRPIRIVLADDAYLVRAALKQFLDGNGAMVVVGECDNADAVVELVDRACADVLITDFRMPPAEHDAGIRLAARSCRTHTNLGVILLSTYADVTYALKLFESGCDAGISAEGPDPRSCAGDRGRSRGR